MRYKPQSFQDFQILIALRYLKLHIYERILTGNEPYSSEIESQIIKNNWTELEMSQIIIDIL